MKYKTIGMEVFQRELLELQKLKNTFDENFERACDLIKNTSGKIIVSGVGKSGHIASKIAATMASTGTPAFFVHPSEACHGDLGMILNNDVLIAISHSGQSSELLTILPILKNRGVKIITITSNNNSSMAKIADVHLCTYVEEEAGPLNLAPTSSTTSTLVLGDALAIAVSSVKDFTREDFAKSHPGGALGKRLLVKNENIMVTEHNIPIVTIQNSVAEAIVEMTAKKLGFTAVVNEDGTIYGIFTDGDLRRALSLPKVDFNHLPIKEIIHQGCQTVSPNGMAIDALKLMQEKSINSMVVINSNNRVIGAFDLHKIIDAGI